METKNKTQIASITLVILSIASSFLFWFLTEGIIRTFETEDWFRPIVFFSLIFVSWSLGIILSKDSGWLKVISLLVLFSGLQFVLNWRHLSVVLIASLLAWIGTLYIRKEMKERIYISIWNALRVGRIFFIMSLAMVIASHYYFNHPTKSDSGIDSGVKVGWQQTWLATKIVSVIDPELSEEDLKEMTIDEFILKNIDLEKRRSADKETPEPRDKNAIPNGILDGITGGVNIEELEERIILEENRKGISDVVGKEIKGNEKIMDIISDFINSRINELIIPEDRIDKETGSAITWFLSVLVFLAVFSFGMFISPALIFICWVLFKILIGLKIVSIEKRETIKEVIV
ncbi:MAG: hypothetical protein PHH24_03285 [Candidatus Moranbacteria bacterium]|jgi:hypothetical protein|nr:hypothetical protein [Candidatus Moranbacteria bacterium]MDX9855946.1 hypothetical protein [Candidatus Moranbacteria bacterium]